MALPSSTVSLIANATSSVLATQSTPAQGSLDSAGAGITGGYTGNSLSLRIIIAFLIGLALYNAIELIVLILVTFQKYHGTYFWSLVVAGFGVMPYSLGFLIKFFQLLDPGKNVCYVAVVLLTVGWWMMVTGKLQLPRLYLLPERDTLTEHNQANPSSSGRVSISSPTHVASSATHST